MIKRKKKPPLTDIEVGSFSDVAFLLIIFFILTTQITRFTGAVVEIPAGQEATSEQKKDDKKQITIHLAAETIQLGEGENLKPVEMESLKFKLLEQNFSAKSTSDEKLVILDCKDDVPYDIYYKVVVLIEDAGGILAPLENLTEKKGE